jgi:hypothetical protein
MLSWNSSCPTPAPETKNARALLPADPRQQIKTPEVYQQEQDHVEALQTTKTKPILPGARIVVCKGGVKLAK